MILELNKNDGEVVFVAEKIVLEPQKKTIIKAPKKGKKVTQKEYEKIVIEKSAEMSQEMGGSGTIFKIGN